MTQGKKISLDDHRIEPYPNLTQEEKDLFHMKAILMILGKNRDPEIVKAIKATPITGKKQGSLLHLTQNILHPCGKTSIIKGSFKSGSDDKRSIPIPKSFALNSIPKKRHVDKLRETASRFINLFIHRH